MPSLSIGWCSCCLYKINIRNWQEGALQRARPTKVAHGQRSGRHEPGMVVGFACAGTENTWCARRTLPHAQFILLIFQGLKLRSAVWRWQRPNRGHATRAVAKPARKKAATPSNTAPPAVGCAVRTKEKISDAALFPNFPGHQGGAGLPGAAGRHPPGHLVRFARGPGKVRETQKNRPVKRAIRLPAKGRSQGPLTGHPGHDRAATPVSKP